MCGICGTYISNVKDNSNLIDSNKLLVKITKIYDKNKSIKIKDIYKDIQKYKSDINFINYFRDSNERKNINVIVSLLKKIKKQIKTNNISIINDCLFSLEVELLNRYKFVINNLDKQYKLNDRYIVFLKVLNSLINSINYLEMRGRDSLGLCIQIKIEKKNYKSQYNLKKNNVNISEYNDFIVLTFVYKTSNSIGNLRQNSKEITNKIFLDNDLLEIINQKYEIISLFFHTRWASVGKINDSNTHPICDLNKKNKKNLISYSAVNGDIYNYKKIIDNYKEKALNINNNCQTDSLALSLVMGTFLDTKKKSFIKKLQGSYCSCTISDRSPGTILLVKNGQQGLYIGNSVDRYFFSSDVYGLVEESDKFFKVENDCFINLPITSKSELVFQNYASNKKHIIKKNNFKKIELSLNDIYLGNNPHFYYKEFKESRNIIQKTNDKYLSTSYFKSFDFKKFKELKNIILKNKIKKIIITGMGTCYTAAVAISQYMREMVTNNTNLNLVIQPHIASEGSGFYTNQNMDDHLIIILGQSGTTVDTNTYAKIGKEKGAYTVSFLNKRQGDLSYLVDLNFYIGDGRDVEISVPSTKTYLAHVTIGYIFTLMIIKNKKNEKIIEQEKNKIIELPNIVEKQIKHVQKNNFNKVTDIFCKNPKWYIVYDDSKLSVTNNEIKIKLSELCYQSIPTFNIKYLIDINIKNSIIIINSSEKYINLRNYINFFLENNNTILILSTELKINLIKHKNLFYFYQTYNENNFELFNSIVFFQYFAYCLAIKLNKRFEFLNNYLNKVNISNFAILQKKLKLDLENGLYNQGGLKNYIKENFIKKNIFSKSKKNKEEIKNKVLFLMRPIDTVKHQAKTITVGATRNTIKNKHKIKIKDSKKNIFKKINVYLFSNYFHESYIYDIVNIFNKYNNNNFYEFHLARSYDLDKISLKKLNYVDLDSIIQPKINNSYLNLKQFEKIKTKLNQNFKLFLKNIHLSPSYQIKNKNFYNTTKKLIKNKSNIKILGSGVNYNAAKLLSIFLTEIFKKPISFEVLENHKHIDVSAEPLLLILLGNINSKIYHNDAISEIIKFHSHNNKCILLSDKNNIQLYKKLPKDILKFEHKKVLETQSFSFYLELFTKIFKVKKNI